MFRRFRSRLKEKKGFTLIELIVVIAIIAILIALLVPNVVKFVKTAKDTADLANVKTIYTAAQAYCTQMYATNADFLDGDVSIIKDTSNEWKAIKELLSDPSMMSGATIHVKDKAISYVEKKRCPIPKSIAETAENKRNEGENG